MGETYAMRSLERALGGLVPGMKNLLFYDADSRGHKINLLSGAPWETCQMGYVVQAEGPGSDAASVTVTKPTEALELAVRWRDDGHAGVRIIGGGRVFMTPEDFATAINNEECQAPSMDRERKTLAEFSPDVSPIARNARERRGYV